MAIFGRAMSLIQRRSFSTPRTNQHRVAGLTLVAVPGSQALSSHVFWLAKTSPDRVTLVESDQRKAVFLRTVSRTLSLDLAVVAARAEALDPLGADVITARALAPLTALLPLVHRHLAQPGGVALLPKGRRAQLEIDEARRDWVFALARHPSMTNPEASILSVGEIARKSRA